MWSAFKFARRPSLWGTLVVIALAVTACSTRALDQPARPASSTNSALNTPTAYPTVTVGILANTPTIQPMATTTVPTTVVTGTSAPLDVRLEAVPIETGWSRCVEGAFWSEDERLVYYASTHSCGTEPLEWVAYDVTTHLTRTISSPLRYDPNIWRRLGAPHLTDEAAHPELRGYVSPSGKQVIYTITYGSSYDPSGRTEIWMADSNGRRKTRLLGFFVGIIHQATWIENETKVVFDYGSEGGTELYIADVQKRTVVPLSQVSDFKGGTDQKWAVSPDGISLAIIDMGYQLWLVSLKDGKAKAIEKYARNPYWSKDGKSLYYWWGPSFRETGTLRVYNTTFSTVSTLVEQSSLAHVLNLPPLAFSDFMVSSGSDKMLLWGGWLWLVELHK